MVDTWVKAIQNNQHATWPGLTSTLVYKHLPKLDAAVKEHMKHQQQNVRSTRQNNEIKDDTVTIEECTTFLMQSLITDRNFLLMHRTFPSRIELGKLVHIHFV